MKVDWDLVDPHCTDPNVSVEVYPSGYCVDSTCRCHGPQRPSGPCCPRCARSGQKPLTVVPPTVMMTLGELGERIVKTRDDHGPMLMDFHKTWYESGHTWVYTHFLGVGLMKCPNDLWVYQDILTAHRPKTIIETGTYQGGSALWFAYLMDMLQIEGGKVLTIDQDDHRTCNHPRITFLAGDSTDPTLAAAVIEQIEYPLLISLDADHSEAHVRKELELYAPACRVDDWLVVEDTNISWVGEHGDRGARGGLEDYLVAHPGEWRQDIISERYLMSCNPGGWLQRVR